MIDGTKREISNTTFCVSVLGGVMKGKKGTKGSAKVGAGRGKKGKNTPYRPASREERRGIGQDPTEKRNRAERKGGLTACGSPRAAGGVPILA